MFKWFGAVGLLLILAGSAAGEQSRPEVWMTHMTPQVLAERGAKWDYVKKHVDAVEIYINVVAFITAKEQIAKLVPVLKQNKIKIVVECGYFDWKSKSNDFSAPNPKRILDIDEVRETFDDKVGEETARAEMAKLANLLEAGGIPDYLNLDGPIRRMMRPGQDRGRSDIKGFATLDRSVDELIDYMRAWHKKYPQIQFFALTNFPNWGWKGETAYYGTGMFNGDYYEVLRAIIARTRAAKIPILGVTVDNPYEYTMGTHEHRAWVKYSDEAKDTTGPADPAKINWMARLLALEGFVENQGLQFNLIVNSEGGGLISAQAFAEGTLKYVDAYRKAGGSPKRWIVQSWYKYPKKVVPETEKYTMTWLTGRVIETVKGFGKKARTMPCR
ncbi:MAG: hypothetical protein ACYTF1_24525 [Planctomycetota bacterium]|jgi:hypothetical protein